MNERYKAGCLSSNLSFVCRKLFFIAVAVQLHVQLLSKCQSTHISLNCCMDLDAKSMETLLVSQKGGQFVMSFSTV